MSNGYNPYTKAPSLQASSSSSAVSEPLYGFLPRHVKAAQVTKAIVRMIPCSRLPFTQFCMQEHDINPFTKQPHTSQYKKILEGRKKLPVFAQMEEFYKIVSQFLYPLSARDQSLL